MTKRTEIIRLNDYPLTYKPNTIYLIKKQGSLRIALSNEDSSAIFHTFTSQSLADLIGQPNGIAGLDSDGELSTSTIPDLSLTYQPRNTKLTAIAGSANNVTGFFKITDGVISIENVTGGGGGGGLTLSNDTTTNTVMYPMLSEVTTGTATDGKVSSTKLYFNPSTGVLNSANFNTLSDRKMKVEISPIKYAIDRIKTLMGYTYRLKDTNRRSVGLIAQEVEDIFPELVDTNEEGIKSLNYDGIVGLLVSGFNEQQILIEQLKETISNLKIPPSTAVY